MPETPDFDQIALTLVQALVDRAEEDLIRPGSQRQARIQVNIAEQLRQVWNARGAADLALIENSFPGTHTKTLDQALRSLDR